MNKPDPLGIITGAILLVLGFAMVLFWYYTIVAAIYGVIFIIVGIGILLTLRKQEEIEKIKKEEKPRKRR